MIPLYSLKIEEHAQSEFKEPLFYEGPHSILPLLEKEVAGTDREHSGIIMLDSSSRVIGMAVLSIGTLTSVTAAPRDILKAALALNASGIITWHTHPSESPQPSPADRRCHKTIAEACKTVGLVLEDDVIFSRDGNLYSFENDKATKDIHAKINRRERQVNAARNRIASGKGSSKDVLACCERDYEVQICKYDFPRDLRIDNCHMAIDMLTPIANSKRTRLQTRHRAKMMLAVVRESLDIIKAGGEPPTVRVD